MPAVAELGRSSERGRTAAAKPDRRPARLCRSGREQHIRKGDELPLHPRLRGRPELPQDTDVLVEPPATILKIGPDEPELALVPAGADPQNHPPATHRVQSSDLLRH